MTYESTHRLRGWRLFWLVVGLVAPLVVLGTACSGSSDRSAGPKTRPTVAPTTPRTSPRTSPGSTPRTTPRTTPNGGRSGAVVVVPRSIDSTGKTDVTRELQQYIDSVKDGRTIRFRPNGRYRIDGTLFVLQRNDLTFDGRGALFFAGTRGGKARAQWWIKQGSNIAFRRMSVRGANPSGGTSEGAYVRKLETQHGFRFEGVNGAEIDHVQVSDVYGDFVYMGRDKLRRPSTNVWIHDSNFRRNGRQGIAVTAASNVVIERNTFNKTRRSTIDLEPNSRSWHVSHVFILNNTVGKGRLLFVASHGQGPVDNIVISGNRLNGHALTIDAVPPEGRRRSNWIITNNVSDTTVHNRPMRFWNIDGLVLSGNTQKVSGAQPGVILTGDCGARVSNNEFGAGGVARHGDRCNAAVVVPRTPSILGRATPTTTPPPPPTTPSGPTTPSTPQPSATFVPPTLPESPVGPGSGTTSSTGWLAVAVVILLATITAALFARSRPRRGNGPS
jgi:hypothetical protein